MTTDDDLDAQLDALKSLHEQFVAHNSDALHDPQRPTLAALAAYSNDALVSAALARFAVPSFAVPDPTPALKLPAVAAAPPSSVVSLPKSRSDQWIIEFSDSEDGDDGAVASAVPAINHGAEIERLRKMIADREAELQAQSAGLTAAHTATAMTMTAAATAAANMATMTTTTATAATTTTAPTTAASRVVPPPPPLPSMPSMSALSASINAKPINLPSSLSLFVVECSAFDALASISVGVWALSKQFNTRLARAVQELSANNVFFAFRDSAAREWHGFARFVGPLMADVAPVVWSEAMIHTVSYFPVEWLRVKAVPFADMAHLVRFDAIAMRVAFELRDVAAPQLLHLIDRYAATTDVLSRQEQAPALSPERQFAAMLEQLLEQQKRTLLGTIRQQYSVQQVVLEGKRALAQMKADIMSSGAEIGALRARIRELRAGIALTQLQMPLVEQILVDQAAYERATTLQRLIAERVEAALRAKLGEVRLAAMLDNPTVVDMELSSPSSSSCESGEIRQPAPTINNNTDADADDDDDDAELAALREAALRSANERKRKFVEEPEVAPAPEPEPIARPALAAAPIGGSAPFFKLNDYESPLIYWRSYRLSPHFRLMTGCKVSDVSFSHTIDPQRLLCRFDTDGVCNDASCAHQHWRDIAPSGEQLVRQLLAYLAYDEEQFAEILSDAKQQRGRSDIENDALARRTLARVAQLEAETELGEEKPDDGANGPVVGIVWRARRRQR
jgi:hypothetical protein